MNEESITLWSQPSCTSLEIAWRALKCNYVQLPSSNQTVSYHTTMVSPCGLVSVVSLSLPHLVLNVKLSEITGVDIALLWLVDSKGRGRIGLSLLEELPFADYGSPISISRYLCAILNFSSLVPRLVHSEMHIQKLRERTKVFFLWVLNVQLVGQPAKHCLSV